MKKLLSTEIILTPVTDYKLISPYSLIGKVWKNNNDVINFPENDEDILKSIQYFGNVPQEIHVLSPDKFFNYNNYAINLFNSQFVSVVSQYSRDSYVIKDADNNEINMSAQNLANIIATTDKFLVGVPSLPTWFIQSYGKNRGEIGSVYVDTKQFVFIKRASSTEYGKTLEVLEAFKSSINADEILYKVKVGDGIDYFTTKEVTPLNLARTDKDDTILIKATPKDWKDIKKFLIEQGLDRDGIFNFLAANYFSPMVKCTYPLK